MNAISKRLAATQPLKIVFLGAPGTGKGTFSSRIGPIFSLPVISTGSLIRNEISSKSQLGQELAAYSSSGILVPDEIITKIVHQHINGKDRFILDGYPRTFSQTLCLDHLSKPTFVINFKLPDNILIKKTIGRRECAFCSQGYNLSDIHMDNIHLQPLLPKITGICDKCGQKLKLIRRHDDEKEIITNRIKIHHKNSDSILKHYKDILYEFSPNLGINDCNRFVEFIKKIIKS